MGKILTISLKLNFTPNTLGCYGLTDVVILHLKMPDDFRTGVYDKKASRVPHLFSVRAGITAATTHSSSG